MTKEIIEITHFSTTIFAIPFTMNISVTFILFLITPCLPEYHPSTRVSGCSDHLLCRSKGRLAVCFHKQVHPIENCKTVGSGRFRHRHRFGKSCLVWPDRACRLRYGLLSVVVSLYQCIIFFCCVTRNHIKLQHLSSFTPHSASYPLLLPSKPACCPL